MATIKQVTKEEFFAALHVEESKGKDIHPEPTGRNYPDLSIWTDHTRFGRPFFGTSQDGKFFLKVVA